MSGFVPVIIIFCFFAVLIFGTHYVRTWAFNRHEAITFESSSITALISLLLIWKYGATVRSVGLFVLLLVMFAANAFVQWHFYMELQVIIRKAFERRAEYLKSQGFSSFVNDTLLTMASVAIMPSFSRFIEESKFFNNPGSFIGLIKSLLKRQRFQKKKYLMRECFAENVNLIGPCKPEIDDMMRDEKHVVPGAIHANDLALGYKQEVIGLVSYDVLGFGALIIIVSLLIYGYYHSFETGFLPYSTAVKVLLMSLTAMAFTFVSHILRHFGFARYESFCYELAFTGLVIAAFRVYCLYFDGIVRPVHYVVLLIYFILFVILSYTNKHFDRSLHSDINKLYEKIIYNTSLETETERTKRRFLTNLKTISEWAVVPFPGSRKRSEFLGRFMVTKKFRKFEEINRKKQDMAQCTHELIEQVVPEFSNDVSESNFILSPDKVRKAHLINNVLSIASFVSLFVLIYLELI